MLVAVLTGVSVAGLAYWSASTFEEHRARSFVRSLAEVRAERVSAVLKQLGDDASFLAHLPTLERASAEFSGNGDGRRPILDDVATAFFVLAERRPYALQVRLLDADGRERVRIDRGERGLYRRSEAELQDKSRRPYFIEGIHGPGARYTDIELNREHGQIERPLLPVARATAAVVVDGTPRGIVVINLDFGALARDVLAEDVGMAAVVDARDDFLFHRDPERIFASELGTGHRASKQLPVARSGDPVFWNGQWLCLTPIDAPGIPNGPLVLVQGVSWTPSAIFRQLVFGVGLLTALVIAFTVALAWYVSRLLTRPLSQVTEAAGTIAAGGPLPDLPTDREDELGALARHFRDMVQALRAQQSELERSNQDLEQFAYTTSHDLKEPLRMVLLHLELLDESLDELPAKSRELLDISTTSAARMAQRIEDLLTYARLGSETLQNGTCDLDAVIERVRQDFALQIQETQAELDVGPLPPVRGDSDALYRIFSNLVGNSLAYHGSDPPHITIRGERRGQFCTFTVQDRGIGIEKKDTERAFHLFQRLRRDGPKRSGMGLALVKRVVERHGGEVWVESEVGAGSTFHFRLQSATEEGGGPT